MSELTKRANHYGRVDPNFGKASLLKILHNAQQDGNGQSFVKVVTFGV